MNHICTPPLSTSCLSPALALPLLTPHNPYGVAYISTLFHIAFLQRVETNLAVFTLSFRHPFPIVVAFDSQKELEFLSVLLRVWCSEIRNGLTGTDDNQPALFVSNMLLMCLHYKIAFTSFVEPGTYYGLL